MTDEELALSLFGEPEKAVLPGSTTTYSGIAASDSEDGHVMVVPNGMAVSGSDTAAVKMACTCAVSKGDPVMISHVDGSPIVTGVVGWGDRLQQGLGSAVSSVSYEYAVSDSGSEAPSSGWSPNWPDDDGTHYIWRRPTWTKANGESATQAPEVARGPGARDGEDATTIDIVSTAGTVFKASSASTVLVAVVYHGAERIENQSQLAAVFGNGSRIQWSYMRTVDQTWQYISADDDRLSDGGFRFAISGDDVTGTLALQADVYVP